MYANRPNILSLHLVLSSLVFWAAFGILAETTSVGQWMYDTGAAHIIAMSFTLLAFLASGLPSAVLERGFRSFVRAAAIAMALLGIAHLFEYLGETRHLFDEDFIPAVVGGTYLLGFLFLGYGARSMLRATGFRTKRLSVTLGVVSAAFAATTVVEIVRFSGHADPWAVYAFAAMFQYVWLLSLGMLFLIGRKISLFQPFVTRISAASFFVMLASLTEFFHPLVAVLHLPEARTENLALYSFFTGLTIFFFAFESLRFPGGIYADVRADAGAHAASGA